MTISPKQLTVALLSVIISTIAIAVITATVSTPMVYASSDGRGVATEDYNCFDNSSAWPVSPYLVTICGHQSVPTSNSCYYTASVYDYSAATYVYGGDFSWRVNNSVVPGETNLYYLHYTPTSEGSYTVDFLVDDGAYSSWAGLSVWVHPTVSSCD